MEGIGAPYPVEVTPEITDLGRFAVEHNKKENTVLEFKKVYSAQKQLVNGTNYYLTLEAAKEGENNFYEATVYVSLENDKDVTEFNIVRVGPGFTHPIDVTPKNTLLEFKKVWSAKEAVVAGFMYYVTLEAADGGDNYVYEATVLEKAGEKVKELLEFKLIGAA
ncbi:UNVERIFIED_CONTAM: Cysteine proteinase inhibitor A [Sesamum radiatum]|uniref:Cysteine proteinase inhibitor n=1 Tax=Sesamum radiatum TaxID=300843 RepID=A0AAW2UPD5_SESRA